MPRDRSDAFDFVLCPSYHGATLLSCLLSNHSQVTALGDTVPIDRLVGKAVCGCGDVMSECEFWTELTDRVSAGGENRDQRLLPLYPAVLEAETLNRVLMRALGYASVLTTPALWKVVGPQARRYVSLYRRFYDAALDMQRTSRFVDGQKSLLKVPVFIAVEGASRVRTMHLVRDPRAAYYSNARRGRAPAPEVFGQQWKKAHERIVATTRHLPRDRYHRLRHEDICADPTAAMDRVQDFLGLKREVLVRSSTAAADKHVVGNEMLKTFDGTIRLDQRWKEAVSPDDQKAIVSAASPLFTEMGYEA